MLDEAVCYLLAIHTSCSLHSLQASKIHNLQSFWCFAGKFELLSLKLQQCAKNNGKEFTYPSLEVNTNTKSCRTSPQWRGWNMQSKITTTNESTPPRPTLFFSPFSCPCSQQQRETPYSSMKKILCNCHWNHHTQKWKARKVNTESNAWEFQRTSVSFHRLFQEKQKKDGRKENLATRHPRKYRWETVDWYELFLLYMLYI